MFFWGDDSTNFLFTDSMNLPKFLTIVKELSIVVSLRFYTHEENIIIAFELALRLQRSLRRIRKLILLMVSDSELLGLIDPFIRGISIFIII